MVRIKSYSTADRCALVTLGLVAFASLFVAVLHESKSPQSGVVAWAFALLFLVPSGVYCFTLATACVLVSGENLQKEYFGICFTAVRIDAIVSAHVAAWGMRYIGRGPYLLLRITDRHGRSIGFSAPREKAGGVFDSIVASVKARKPNQSPDPTPGLRPGVGHL